MKGNVTLEEKQKAYVKDSLTRAIREMKVAKIEGRKLQSVDDFINEISDKNALSLVFKSLPLSTKIYGRN